VCSSDLYSNAIQITDCENANSYSVIVSFQYIVCIAPTLRQWIDGSVAPAGTWKIKVRNNHNEQVLCVLSVQTDQSLLPNRPVNLKSYFDDPKYRKYDDAGRPIDSYSYSKWPNACPENTDVGYGENVRRHGTMNASASHNAVARVGGYRSSDGKPAPYSATGRGGANGSDDGVKVRPLANYVTGHSGAPTVSLPTDDGPAHFGILAAGAANGSVSAMRGTSFGSSQATRCVLHSWLIDRDHKKSAKSRLYDLASNQKTKDVGSNSNGKTESRNSAKDNCEILDIEKSGRWQIRSPLSPRVDRLGSD